MTPADVMLQAYIRTALWAETDESRDDGGDPFDQNYSPADLAEETVAASTRHRDGSAAPGQRVAIEEIEK